MAHAVWKPRKIKSLDLIPSRPSRSHNPEARQGSPERHQVLAYTMPSEVIVNRGGFLGGEYTRRIPIETRRAGAIENN